MSWSHRSTPAPYTHFLPFERPIRSNSMFPLIPSDYEDNTMPRSHPPLVRRPCICPAIAPLRRTATYEHASHHHRYQRTRGLTSIDTKHTSTRRMSSSPRCPCQVSTFLSHSTSPRPHPSHQYDPTPEGGTWAILFPGWQIVDEARRNQSWLAPTDIDCPPTSSLLSRIVVTHPPRSWLPLLLVSIF
jgi:hypothetical protein